MADLSLTDFHHKLRSTVKGDVFFDRLTRGLYATDASIYEVMPACVVLPKDAADVNAAVAAVAEYKVPVTCRGAGTSLNGQAVGAGMVLDFSHYMNNILQLDADEKWVRVQPGIVLDELNAGLAEHNLLFAPDPATGNRATIGGMIANNSSGIRSLLYGLTSDHILEVKVLLSDGTTLQLKPLAPDEYNRLAGPQNPHTRESRILTGLKQIIDANRDEIQTKYPAVMRRVQGYSLDAFIEPGGHWNLTRLIAGSEGTLAVLLEAKLKLEPRPAAKALCAVHFARLGEALESVRPILRHNPSAVEIIDEQLITRARRKPTTAPLCGFIQGGPEAILIVEFFGDSPRRAEQKARDLAADLEKSSIGYAAPVITERDAQASVWRVRKDGLGLMTDLASPQKPTPIIEDACVPLDHLPEYIDRILDFCRKRDIPVSMYAHASVGTIHVRPCLDLKQQSEIDKLNAVADFAFDLVTGYGGSISGEHGDGRARSPYLKKYFGPAIYNAFCEIKKLFDPQGLLNPGIIVDADPIDTNLRYNPQYKTAAPATEYHYRETRSFAAAVETCTGVGACRQTLDGTMCPSYRATRDERHLTRGRANALRLAISGHLGADAFTGKDLYRTLELCLSCKACKAECPNNVDVARLKSEFLQLYHDTRRTGLRERIVVASPTMARLTAGWKAPVVNRIQKNWLFRKTLELLAGFDSRRIAPAYARTPLPKWFAARPAPADASSRRKVVLFDDTYMNYHQTEVGISAVELLESAGYHVILARAGCCQRPAISHGFLRRAKARGEKTLRNLDAYIRQGLKVVVCEPGCCSALTDDLPDLIDDEDLAARIKQNVMMIDRFLLDEINSGNLTCKFASPFAHILIHGHCHQKALFGTTAMKQILDSITGLSVSEIDSGCCGMAGSFGYEKEHYDLSMQIAEDRLLPAVRNRPQGAAVIACGFSCRHQITDATGVKPLHFVQTLRAEK